MSTRFSSRLFSMACLAGCVWILAGCARQEEPSSLIGAYTFSRDLDWERRVLHLQPSQERATECMRAALPTREDSPWKEMLLPPELHRSLTNLLFDESRRPYYEVDTLVADAAEEFVCGGVAGQPDFCFAPQVVVTATGAPLRFGLQPEIRLSAESQELIDAFLLAHELCWSSGTSMNGGD